MSAQEKNKVESQAKNSQRKINAPIDVETVFVDNIGNILIGHNEIIKISFEESLADEGNAVSARYRINLVMTFKSAKDVVSRITDALEKASNSSQSEGSESE